jgi:hypothetical protein
MCDKIGCFSWWKMVDGKLTTSSEVLLIKSRSLSNFNLNSATRCNVEIAFTSARDRQAHLNPCRVESFQDELDQPSPASLVDRMSLVLSRSVMLRLPRQGTLYFKWEDIRRDESPNSGTRLVSGELNSEPQVVRKLPSRLLSWHFLSPKAWSFTSKRLREHLCDRRPCIIRYRTWGKKFFSYKERDDNFEDVTLRYIYN